MITRRQVLYGAGVGALAPVLESQTAFDWGAMDGNVIAVARDLVATKSPLAGGALRAMHAQWETCGLNRWVAENLASLWSMPVNPDTVTEAAASMGILLPDGWWLTTFERMQRWKHGGAMWQENARRLLEYHPEAANPWWQVGGFGLVLIGAAAIAFAPATIAGLAIVGAGIGIAGIGVAFILGAGV